MPFHHEKKQLDSTIKNLVVIVENPKQVENASPDLARLASLAYRALILSAHVSDSEIYSRCFYPKYGVNKEHIVSSFPKGQVIEDRVFMSRHCKSFLERHIFTEETYKFKKHLIFNCPSNNPSCLILVLVRKSSFNPRH